MQSILALLLILLVLFADVYFIFPWLSASNLFLLSTTFLVLTNIRRITFFDYAPNENKYLKRLLIIFYLFLAYMSLNDFLHGIWMEKAPSMFILSLFPFVLIAFRTTTDKSRLLFLYLKLFIIYNFFFSLLQFAGVHITVGSLLSFTPLIGVEQLFIGATDEGLRITGAYGNTLNVAAIAGYATIIFYFTIKDKLLRWQKKSFRYFLLAIAMVLTTQTRAAVLGTVIAIIFVELFTASYNTRKIKFVVVLSGIALAIFYFGVPYYFEDTRLLKFDDTSFLSRIQINYFAILGTIKTAPFLGIPYLVNSAQEEAISRVIQTGIMLSNVDFGPIIFDFVTFHCEPAFYLRSYGLIGFVFYLLFYFSLFNYIKNSDKHTLYKKALFCIVIAFFLFNLTHNGKIIQSLVIWILLSLDFKNNIIAEKS